ncbi:hypothetical protein BDE02_01G283100 [Populus trichocarpa]|nr:hypothetical protein BDE02_01G283100 [Populus trichocarpa]
MVSGSVKRMAVGEGSCGRVCDRLEAVGKEKKKMARGRRRLLAFGFKGRRRRKALSFFFQREGKGGCLAKEEREMGAAGDDGGLIRGWQRRRKMGEPTGK